jgi:hypothetical protein
MEPFEHRQLEDSELREILGAWKAPPTPPDLARRILRRRSTWRRWFLTGSIRVPVPLGAAVLLLLLGVWGYGRVTSSSVAVPEPVPVSLADFRPVAQLEPRVVGDIR